MLSQESTLTSTDNIIIAMEQEKLKLKLSVALLSMLLKEKPSDITSKMLMDNQLEPHHLEPMDTDFKLLTHTLKSGLLNTDGQDLLVLLKEDHSHAHKVAPLLQELVWSQELLRKDSPSEMLKED
jgi:hypothetical protein